MISFCHALIGERQSNNKAAENFTLDRLAHHDLYPEKVDNR